jgi:hypothetical protein
LLALGGVPAGSTTVPTPLPDSTGIAGCVAGGTVISTDPCSFGGASAFTVGAPFATAEAMVAAPPGFGPGANSALTYFYTVDGPDNGPIAIGIATNLLTFTHLDNTAFAGISTSQGTNVCADTNAGLCGGSQFDGILIEMDEPGQVYSGRCHTNLDGRGAGFGGPAELQAAVAARHVRNASSLTTRSVRRDVR